MSPAVRPPWARRSPRVLALLVGRLLDDLVGCLQDFHPAALRVLLALVLGWALPGARAQSPDCPPPLEPPTLEMAAAGLRDARDRGFLWRVEKGGHASFLYGTLHVARREWMFPGPRVRQALAASDTLALELDLLDPQTARRMAAGIEAPASAPLPAALQRRIERRALQECADPAAIARLGPELKITALTMLAARRQGLEAAYGIDLFLAGFARSQGTSVRGLETPQEQLDAIAAGAPGDVAALLDSGLRELDAGRAQALLARLAHLWAEGDLATLSAYPQWCQCMATPAEAAAMRRLLDDRNPVLAQRVDALHTAGSSVFAAVGSLHMIGAEGLPALLAQRGYRVQRIVFEPAALALHALWDFGDPGATEQRLEAALALAGGDAALVLKTQLARTHGLRQRFAEGHALLDAIEPALPGAGPEARVRALLERGRLLRSAGDPASARPLFERALARADEARLADLAIDAMHMVALVQPDLSPRIDWNRRALDRARSSADPAARRWEASLAHNLGMALMEAGRPADALQSLRSALAASEREGRRPEIRVARWAVAWALRQQGRHAEALDILLPLAREMAADGARDGWICEELGENLLALGRGAEARSWFAQAHELLSMQAPPERPDDRRLDRLLELSR